MNLPGIRDQSVSNNIKQQRSMLCKSQENGGSAVLVTYP